MQQWEYRVERTWDYWAEQAYWNGLGRAGWELVGVYSMGDKHYAIFKRPRISAPDPASILIDDIDLSVRSYNCLKRANIYTVGDFIDYCIINRTGNRITVAGEKILKIRNMGRKSLDEIQKKIGEKLGEMGLELVVVSDEEAVTSNAPPTIARPDIASNDDAKIDERKRMTVAELDISVRTFNFLKRRNIHTVADLLNYSEEELRRSVIDTIWEKHWEKVSGEIKQNLSMMSLSLREEP